MAYKQSILEAWLRRQPNVAKFPFIPADADGSSLRNGRSEILNLNLALGDPGNQGWSKFFLEITSAPGIPPELAQALKKPR